MIEKIYEITIIYDLNKSKTVTYTESEALEEFGENWPEYRANYLPHVVVLEI